MALSSTPSVATAPVARSESAPIWVFPLYLGGLLLVYIGEHVLSGLPKGAGFVTVLGLLATVAATVLRFAPRFRSGGERHSIESLLAVLSVVGVLGLLVYFGTSEFGAAKLGIDHMASEARTKLEELSRVLWVALILIAVVPMVFAETALRPMRNAEFPESRRVRSAATAGLVLALAAVYSAFFVYAAGGVDMKIDYSFFKTSRPSESTRKLATSLSGDPIRVVAFFPDVNEVRKEVESYLKDLATGAPKLKIEVKDRLLVPKLAQELHATQDGVIVLSRGTVNHNLQLGTDIEQARPKLKTLDRDFQEQLTKIARSKHTAYLTVGHGEINDGGRGKPEDGQRSAQIARQLLQKQNYTLKDLGVAQGLAADVPDDAEVVLVLGPTSPFAAEELAALKRYGDRGGRLLIALEPESIGAQDVVTAEQANAAVSAGAAPSASAGAKAASAAPEAAQAASPPTSNFDLARLVGLKFAPEVLANEKQNIRVRLNNSDRTRLGTASFSSHAAVSMLSRNAPRWAVVVFGAGSLDKAAGATERVDFSVKSLPGTFQDANRSLSQDPSEKPAVWNLAAAVTRAVSAPAEPKKDDKDKKGDKDKKPEESKEERAFVLADGDAFSDFVMGNVVGNQILFVDAVRWLVGEGSVQGLPNTEEDVRMEHTKQADLGWFYAMIFGAPCLTLAAGVWVSRRSRGRGGKR